MSTRLTRRKAVSKGEIINGDCREVMRMMADNSIDCVVTSPPYYGLRKYAIADSVWDGDPDCQHEWVATMTERPNSQGGQTGKQMTNVGSYFTDYHDRVTRSNTCVKCGAWRGQLGLEPHPDMFVEHLVSIFDEVKRILKPTGSLYINLGDSYSTQSGRMGTNDRQPKATDGEHESMNFKQPKLNDIPHKSLTLVPMKFALKMFEHGWSMRNVIIWHRSNSMPDSAYDRYTVDFEYLFFFTQGERKKVLWQNIETKEWVDKKPPSTAGKENVDWMWKEHKTKGKVKSSLWRGFEYFFEEQLEPYVKPLDRWGGDDLVAKNKSEWDEGTGQTSYRDRCMRPNPEGRKRRAVWSIPTRPSGTKHYAAFPPDFVRIPLLAGCPKNGIVLDPFGGVGTVGLVAEELGLKYILIEAGEDYCNQAKERIGLTTYVAKM